MSSRSSHSGTFWATPRGAILTPSNHRRLPTISWDRRFFSSTRGQVVALLRRASRTVDELAAALGLTDNAVRAHLATLERDGLVRHGGVRRRAGKPAYAYELTPEAERLFPKAYEPVLGQLLDVLAERFAPEVLDATLREAGHRLALRRVPPAGDLRGRVDGALALLGEFGGLAELEEHAGGFLIRSYSCPLTAVVPRRPEVCRLLEALLQDVIAAPVRERCERAEPPRCSFEVAAVGGAEAPTGGRGSRAQ